MKNAFAGYYPPSPEEYSKLLHEGLIILDTNVLLNLYRLPAAARTEFINVLKILKDRLWIPHQVALEYQRNRLNVIKSERKTIEDALKSTSELVESIKEKVNRLQLDKRDLNINPQPLLEELERANTQLIDALQKTHSSQLDISTSDPIRDELDKLFENRVGTGPIDQNTLDQFVCDGKDRYAKEIPPGFGDIGKSKNPKEATYIFDSITYEAQFGDLILWKQILKHTKDNEIKIALLVTADKKPDWWWEEYGRTIGPRPQLIREAQKEGNLSLFWMYSSSQFLEHAKEYLNATVSSESVEELEQAATSLTSQAAHVDHFFPQTSTNETIAKNINNLLQLSSFGNEQGFSDRKVLEWVSTRNPITQLNEDSSPSIIAVDGNGLHGYEIIYTNDVLRFIRSPRIVATVLRAQESSKNQGISRLSIIIVIPRENVWETLDDERLKETEDEIWKTISIFSVSSLTVGFVSQTQFEPIINLENPNDNTRRRRQQ